MAKTIKSLLRISMVIRNLGTLNNFSVAKRLIRTSAACSSDYTKDSLVSARPHLIIQDDTNKEVQTGTLLRKIKNSETIPEVFELIENNSKTLKAAHAAVALRILYNIDKASHRRAKKMYEQKEFLTLCEIVKKEAQALTTKDVLNALRAFVHFNVPASSVIVNIVLQILRQNLNELSLRQLILADKLLENCENTPLVDALKLALPIVFHTHVLRKVDRQDLDSLVSCLEFTYRRTPDSEAIESLIAAIENCGQPIDVRAANSILWALTGSKCRPEGLPYIVKNVQNILTQNIASLSRGNIKHMLMKVASAAKHGPFYHEGFADACASIVISEDWGFTDAVVILNKLVQMNHAQTSLLDYIAAKCFEDQTILETCPAVTILHIVTAFSDADYKPVFWEAMQAHLISDRVLEETSEPWSSSLLAVHLTALDCYCPNLWARVFSTSHVDMERLIRGRALLLYQAAKTLYPQYQGPWPDQSIVEYLSPKFRELGVDFPLLNALESALGGSRYVLTNVRTSLGHHIDHVIVMRKGGFAVAINNNDNNHEDDTESDTFPVVRIDDLQPPADGQVLLILYVPVHGYSVNTQRLKGFWTLKIRTLEALTGYTVIPINSMMWTDLPLTERIPYLMQAIRLKCDEVSITTNRENNSCDFLSQPQM